MAFVSPSTLYVCATPIGNLADVSSRLVSVLGAVDYILCEDTRVTSVLLKRAGILKRTVAFNHHQEKHRMQRVFDDLRAGHSVALVSDAGTPGICDPGCLIVKWAREAGFQVVPVPGPSAVATFLSVAGLDFSSFWFIGFIPKRLEAFAGMIQTARSADTGIVFFESPHRLRKTLDWLADRYPEATVTLGKELTKSFERIITGSPARIVSQADSLVFERGEWIGCVTVPPVREQDDLRSWVQTMASFGLSRKQMIVIGTTYFGYKKNQLYQEINDTKLGV